MKTFWGIGLGIMAGLTAHAGTCNVVVYVHQGVTISAGMATLARLTAQSVFREIGVEVRWRTGDVRNIAADRSCGAPIEVVIENAPLNGKLASEVLAYAKPFQKSGTSIHVFLDRIRKGGIESSESRALGHVLAHEIGHVLEGTAGHSRDGVMKAHWEGPDYLRMEVHRFGFAPMDAMLIHSAISDRPVGVSADGVSADVIIAPTQHGPRTMAAN
jgi:hypothetical protein